MPRSRPTSSTSFSTRSRQANRMPAARDHATDGAGKLSACTPHATARLTVRACVLATWQGLDLHTELELNPIMLYKLDRAKKDQKEEARLQALDAMRAELIAQGLSEQQGTPQRAIGLGLRSLAAAAATGDRKSGSSPCRCGCC